MNARLAEAKGWGGKGEGNTSIDVTMADGGDFVHGISVLFSKKLGCDCSCLGVGTGIIREAHIHL